MKKKILSVVMLIVIVIGLIGTALFLATMVRSFMVSYAAHASLTDAYLSMTLSLLSAMVASLSLSLIIFQQHRSTNASIRTNELSELEFLLKYNQTFIQDDEMVRAEQELEMDTENRKKLIIDDSNRQRMINYLVYLEGLAPTVLKGVMRLESIDDLMAYRYFIAVNNHTLQMNQLFPYPQYYKGCFKLYKAWKKYRVYHNEDILNDEYGLDKWIHFDKYAGTNLKVRKATRSDNKRQIAKLIYHTDPYIYPAAFGSESRAVKALSKLYSTPGNIFSYQNIWVAVKHGKIVGAAVVLQKCMEKSLLQLLGSFRGKDSFRDVTEKYFDQAYPDSEDGAIVLCLSVKLHQQKQRIGRQLLSHIVSDSECMNKKVKLGVLADNFVAVKLYKECGFIIENEILGYAYKGDRPQVYEMERKAESTMWDN